MLTNESLILTCTNQNDRFTVDDTSKGNGALTYPVGLITADEVAMGGAVYGSSNSSYYLYTGYFYWTMSPDRFYGSYAYEFDVSLDGNINDNYVNNSSGGSGGGVRPVLSLKSDVQLSGSGAINDPWIVQN